MSFVEIPIRRGFTEIAPLFELIKDHGVICGGYARYCASPLLNPHATSDVDVYAWTEESFEEIRKALKGKLTPKRNNAVSYVYSRATWGPLGYCPEVNLIKPMVKGRMITVGDTETILGNFDFSIARAAIVSPTTALVDVDFEEHELLNRLVLKNIHCPISSTLRCAKYVAKGYQLPVTEVLKLFKDWDARTPEYREEIIAGLREIEEAWARNEQLSGERMTAIYELMKVD